MTDKKGPGAGGRRLPPPPGTGDFRVKGRWARDWRIRGNLVGKGELRMDMHGVQVRAGRTGWVRGILLWGVRLLAWLGFFGACGAGVLTGIGLTVRTKTPEWLGAAVVAVPLAMLASWLFAWIGRRLLERPKTWTLPWSAVESVGAARGPWLHLAFRDGGSLHVGRFKARRFPPALRATLSGLRDLVPPPMAPRNVEVAILRSAWPDRLIVYTGVAAACAGAVMGWPMVRPMLEGPPIDGPNAGVPARADAAVIEAAAVTLGACPAGPDGSPGVRNRQRGNDLSWTLEGDDDWVVVNARVDQAGVSFLGSSLERTGTARDALANGPAVGISMVAHTSAKDEVRRHLEAGDLEGALCSGEVARLDRSMNPALESTATVALTRDGSELVVDVAGPEKRYAVLAARQRDQRRLDWFDRCELAVHKGKLVLPETADGTVRLPGFFGSSRDEARVVVVPKGRVKDVRKALGDAEHVPCWKLDALSWLGPAAGWGTTSRGDGALQARAAEAVRSSPVLSKNDGTEEMVKKIHARYLSVVEELQPRGRAEWQAVDAGFLAALPWGDVLDRVSMQHDIAQLERIRQRLSGADGEGTMGEMFLLRLAEEFLERIPPEADLDQYNARVDVAEAWLDVDGGTTWTPNGRTVTVPSDEVAAYYQVVGHYLLVDVARRAEAHMSRSMAFRVTGLPLRWELENHGINLDIEKSTTQKALEAWVTGDFEYLGDRALAKLQEQVADQSAIIAAASGADYDLKGQWSAGDGAARTATLYRGGKEIGWVALYDATQVRMGYHDIQARGTSRAALGGGKPALLAAAGSYVTSSNKTSGLSAVDGTVENFLISNKMDGLVIIDGDGELSMLDMRRGGVLPGQQVPIRPLESLADLHALLRWIDDNDASAFQTHLLGAGGQLIIDESTASPTLRERRLLVQCAYKGHPIIAVVDLPGTPKVSLFEAAVISVQALRTPQSDGGPELDVLAIANLDVGSFNALEAWTDEGRGLRSSWKPLGETMNLVSISRR